MLRRQFQKQVVAWIVVVAEPRCFEAVIVSGSLLQLLGHFHPSDEHRTITASNAVLYTVAAAVHMVVGIRRTVSLYGTVTRLAPAGRHPPGPSHQIHTFMKNPHVHWVGGV